MKLTDLDTANHLFSALRELRSQKEHVKGNGLGVTILGRYQDDVFLAAVRPFALSELDRRIAYHIHQLRELGIKVDE